MMTNRVDRAREEFIAKFGEAAFSDFMAAIDQNASLKVMGEIIGVCPSTAGIRRRAILEQLGRSISKQYAKHDRYPLVQVTVGEYTLSVSSHQKELFDERHGAGKFERLLKLLFDGCSTMDWIGRRFGITRQRIDQIYDGIRRLNPEIGSGRSRRNSCSIVRGAARTEFTPTTLTVWREARRRGLTVEPIRRVGLSESHRGRLLISGIVCKVRLLGKPWRWIFKNKSTRGSYYRTSTPYSGTEFLIAITPEPDNQLYIIPTAEISGRNIYIAEKNWPITDHRAAPRFKYAKYRDAWHLLMRNGESNEAVDRHVAVGSGEHEQAEERSNGSDAAS